MEQTHILVLLKDTPKYYYFTLKIVIYLPIKKKILINSNVYKKNNINSFPFNNN